MTEEERDWTKVPVGRKHVARCDEDDFETLMRFAWNLSSEGYAERRFKSEPCPHCGRRASQVESMQRRVARAMGILCDANADSVIIDHANGDRLDCRRSNLRASTKTENGHNKAKQRRQTIYKGVSRTSSLRYGARITVAGRIIGLGVFDDAGDAARVYDVAAVWAFGDFARINFPENWNEEGGYIG